MQIFIASIWSPLIFSQKNTNDIWYHLENTEIETNYWGAEAVSQACSIEKVFLEMSQNTSRGCFLRWFPNSLFCMFPALLLMCNLIDSFKRFSQKSVKHLENLRLSTDLLNDIEIVVCFMKYKMKIKPNKIALEIL